MPSGQTGGPDADGTVLRLEGEELLSSGDEVLLFLKWDQEIDRYWIVSGSHGHFRVSNGMVSHANFRLTDSDPHPLALAVDGRTETDLAELVVRRG